MAVVCVPDLDGDNCAALAIVKDALLTLRAWEREEDPPLLPAPLAGGFALAAVTRVCATLQQQPRLDSADVATAATAARLLAHPGAGHDIVDAVEEVAYAHGFTRPQVLSQLARLVDLLELKV